MASFRIGHGARLDHRRRSRRGRRHRARALDEAPEDHLPRRRLQHAGDDDVDVLADHPARVVDDHHRPVVQVGDPLVVFLAFLQDEDLHELAGEDDRLERVGELVDVEDVDAAELGHLVQVEVVGDDLSLERAPELDQLQVDLAHFGKVDVGDGDVDAGHLLDLLEDVEAAAAAVALQRVGGIGDQLQLLEHELRDHERAVEKAGLAHVGDAAVDDDAGVENAVALLGPGVAEQADEARRFQPLPLARAHHDPEIREDEQDEAVEEDDPAVRRVRPEEGGADGLRQAESDRPADERAQEVGHLRGTEPRLDIDDEDAERDTNPEVDRQAGMERTRQGRRPRNGGYEQRASNEMPGHGYDSGYETPSSYPRPCSQVPLTSASRSAAGRARPSARSCNTAF